MQLHGYGKFNSIISENNKYDEISWGIMSELNLS